MSVPAGDPAGDPALADMSLPERVEYLRRRMASVPARGETRADPVQISAPASRSAGSHPAPMVRHRHASQPEVPRKPVLAVPDALASILPHGGLVQGSVAAVSGAGSLLLGMVAAVTASGKHVAVIGQPRFGLLAAAEMGAELHRLAVVPDPGEDPVEVAAILLDGLDLVVLGLGGRSVPPSRARAVVARARSKGATLLVTDGQWDGIELRLDAVVRSYGGVGTGARSGRGRLRTLQLEVRAQGKAMRPRTTRVDLRSEQGRVQWTVAPEIRRAAVDSDADDLAVLA
ncbi:hypothetical protein DK926_19825 [Rhodococcus sp. Eu-32]|uniref:hypothetical protein n=1 Tax=Rhodococcus sp. Eu-32 TaxID=1017319 RepID=UPI000DF4B7AB|nr:hypothetical protein [Rhodococcus sp. Eu-32]RRQ26037.1 hypothetical protein DK926_19825 [Rhodococcus sp. Eu-32]